jgi:small-conductance mechanosensitive channel
MQADILFLGLTAAPLALRAVAVLAFAALLVFLKRLFFARIHALAGRTDSRLDDLIVRSLGLPLNLFILVASLYVGVSLLPVDGEWRNVALLALRASLAAAVFSFVDRLLVGLIDSYGDRVEAVAHSRGILKGVLHAVLIFFFVMVLFDLIGISVTPLVASLGVGSLAVALAFQDTLSNFFAGIYTMIDKPVRVGDFVRLEGGEEGTVSEVGWRSTRVKLPSNNTVILPNNKLTGSVITNYSLPEPETAVLVQVGVHYDSDLAQVERVVCEVGRQIMETVEGGCPGFVPAVRFHTFDASSINFTAVLRARSYTDQHLLRHEFIKALHERFRQEGIVIPFPIRTLDVSGELLERVGAGRAAGSSLVERQAKTLQK